MRRGLPFASTSKFTLERFARPASTSSKVPPSKEWASWFFSASPTARPPLPLQKREKLQKHLALLSDQSLVSLVNKERSSAKGTYLWLILSTLEQRAAFTLVPHAEITTLFQRIAPAYFSHTEENLDRNGRDLLARYKLILSIYDANRTDLSERDLLNISSTFRRSKAAPHALEFFAILKQRGLIDPLPDPLFRKVIERMLWTIQGWLKARKDLGTLSSLEGYRMNMVAKSLLAQLDARDLSNEHTKTLGLYIEQHAGTFKTVSQYLSKIFKFDLNLPQQIDGQSPLTKGGLNSLVAHLRSLGKLSAVISTYETNSAVSTSESQVSLDVDRLGTSLYTNLLLAASEARSPLLIAHYFKELSHAAQISLDKSISSVREALNSNMASRIALADYAPSVAMEPLHFKIRLDRKRQSFTANKYRDVLAIVQKRATALQTYKITLEQHVSLATLKNSAIRIHDLDKYLATIQRQIVTMETIADRLEERIERFLLLKADNKYAAKRLRNLSDESKSVITALYVPGHKREIAQAAKKYIRVQREEEARREALDEAKETTTEPRAVVYETLIEEDKAKMVLA